MSVNRLVRLLEAGEYRLCLEEAVGMLEREADAESMARIHSAICRSRLALTDYCGAAEAGQQAVDLAKSAGAADVFGFALVDLAKACVHIRQHERAQAVLHQYLNGIPQYTAARCMEGTALQCLAASLQQTGAADAALERYRQARAWFDRFGDEWSAQTCSRAMLRLHLDHGDLQPVVDLLREGSAYAEAHPEDRAFAADHLLDRALYALAKADYPQSIREAFQALQFADDRLVQQTRAHLILCQNALAQNKPGDALNFAMAARVTAIDGRLYDLEFEASDILHRLLRERGARLIRELEQDYLQCGVDIFHYLSDRVINRMMRSN